MELVYRLEAATSRLEDMAMAVDDSSSPKNVGAPATPAPATPEPPKPTPPPPAAPVTPQIPPQIQDFDALIKGDIQNFVSLGEKIGGLVAEQVSYALVNYKIEWLLIVSHRPTRFCRPSKPSVPISSFRPRPRSPSPSTRS